MPGQQTVGPEVLLRKMTGWTVEILDRTTGALVARFSREVDGLTGVRSSPLALPDLVPGRYAARVQTVSFMATDETGRKYDPVGTTVVSDWSESVPFTIWPSSADERARDADGADQSQSPAAPVWNDLRNDVTYDIEFTPVSRGGLPEDPFLVRNQRLQTGLWPASLRASAYTIRMREVAIRDLSVVRSEWSEPLTTTIAARTSAAWRAACPWVLDNRLNPANRVIQPQSADGSQRIPTAGGGGPVGTAGPGSNPSDEPAAAASAPIVADQGGERAVMFNQRLASAVAAIRFHPDRDVDADADERWWARFAERMLEDELVLSSDEPVTVRSWLCDDSAHHRVPGDATTMPAVAQVENRAIRQLEQARVFEPFVCALAERNEWDAIAMVLALLPSSPTAGPHRESPRRHNMQLMDHPATCVAESIPAPAASGSAVSRPPIQLATNHELASELLIRPIGPTIPR